MRLRRALALAGAVAAAAFSACDLPFAPKWDADMYLPLSTKSIYLNNAFPFGFIPPSTSGSVSFPPQQQDVSGAVKDVLKNLVTDPTRALTVLTLTVGKHTAISARDTLFVAPDSASLTAPNPGRVVFPIALLTTDTSVTQADTITLASIQMMQDAASSQSPLWIQMRGQVSNPGASPLTITQADSITIKLTVTARVAVSHR
jgi:hypothetical protein